MQEEADITQRMVHDLWDHVVTTCNRILHNAGFYGFEFMHIPDPDVTEVAQLLDTIVVPILRQLISDAELPAEQNMKLINIKHYCMIIKDIAIALECRDRVKFDASIAKLESEAMLI